MNLYVDTSAWVALASVQDDHHRAAAAFAKRSGSAQRYVTSEGVLGEAVTLLNARRGHAAAVGFLDSLGSDARSPEIVFPDEGLRAETLAIFRKTADQTFSYVDCQSFAIMRRMRIADVFTFDEDFARFGFTVRPGPWAPRRRETGRRRSGG